MGKAKPWAYEAPSEWEQELNYWVEWMVAQRQIVTNWQGRLEGLVSRHWPEATRVLKLTSVTLLRLLKHYGDPKSLAADPEAAEQLGRWGGLFLAPKKIEQLVAEARSSVGVRVGEWQQRQIQEYAREGADGAAAGQGGGTAVAPVGRREYGSPGPGKGGGSPDGVCSLGEHG